MIALIADFETTGTNPENDRIIEVGFILYDLDENKLIRSLYRQHMPDRIIDPKSELVHGISIRDLESCDPFKTSAISYASNFIEPADVIVAHNAAFDVAFLVAEMARNDVTVDWSRKQMFCTMENGRWATPHGKVPRLEELCYACDIPYDHTKAHNALYDCIVTTKCLLRGINEGLYKL